MSRATALGLHLRIEPRQGLLGPAEELKLGLEVIYGDTDSVMIKFGTADLGESMRLGNEAAEKVSATFLKPIKCATIELVQQPAQSPDFNICETLHSSVR